jgi:hypothetical protein
MSTGTEDFEKLQKLLKFKRLEQPPPGYFNRFSSVVINRLEREGLSNHISEVPWLKKLMRLFESSPVAAGLFGAALCAVVIFGIAAANKADKAPTSAFAPVADNAIVDANASSSLALNEGVHSGRSTDAIFGPNVLNTPNSMTAQIEPVSFSTSSSSKYNLPRLARPPGWESSIVPVKRYRKLLPGNIHPVIFNDRFQLPFLVWEAEFVFAAFTVPGALERFHICGRREHVGFGGRA